MLFNYAATTQVDDFYFSECMGLSLCTIYLTFIAPTAHFYECRFNWAFLAELVFYPNKKLALDSILSH